MKNSFWSFLLVSNKEKRDKTTTSQIIKLWMKKAITEVQITAYTLKLAHCIKQNGQEKSSVTTFGKKQKCISTVKIVFFFNKKP